ncbi:MAG TPA: nucleotide sugar dehydrogenase [Ktedonobacteraceae bacterium]|nr:nucleotide sugar dehydrogenase [Ktedonobacteraceae bacterium]
MATICVIGTGYVGLVTGTCFADMGNRVTCVDIIPEKIERLKNGVLPIYEPGLKEMVERNVHAGRLHFTTSYAEGLNNAEFIFIAVNTPTGSNQGSADMSYVERAAQNIAEELDHYTIIINKSTVPVGSGDVVKRIVSQHLKRPEVRFSVVSNPEFLAEGSAVADFQNPDRVVLGSSDPEAANQVATLYLPLRAPIVITDLYTAEMIKYASNAFLATKISFINEIAQICERLGADVKEVATGMGHDKRIGQHFLNAGLGYGGSCFEADETVFALNSPHVATERFDMLFRKGGTPFQGDIVDLVQPSEQRVLAFDLETGQPVLADVKAMTRRPYKGTMVTIMTSMGRTLRVTADHPVVVYQDQQFAILPASMVVPEDQLMALCELPPVEQATNLNVLALLAGSSLENDVYVKAIDTGFSKQYEQFAAAIPQDMLQFSSEIRQKNHMPLRLFRYLSDMQILDIPTTKLMLYTAKDAATPIKAVLPVDADFLRLCGYYLATGCLFEDKDRELAEICFHEQEPGYSADVQHILERWGLAFTEKRSTNALTTTVSSHIFSWLLRDILHCGTCSEDKALPRLVFNVAPELRLELIRGAFSGDGATTIVQDGQDLVLEYATVSKALADGMTLLLQTSGVIPSISTRQTATSAQAAYILRVSGHEQLSVLKNAFGKQHLARIESLQPDYQRYSQPHDFKRYGAFAALTVSEVEHQEVETTVYSMETSTGTLIASSGLISHNCFPKDVRALAYMADEAGLHPQLLHAVMEINHDQRRGVLNKLVSILGSLRGCVIGVLGLAFKPNTDDMREAPAVDIIRWITSQGAQIQVYDPVARETGQAELERSGVHMEAVTFCEDAYTVARDADALVIATEWNEFKSLNMLQVRDLMRRPIIIDGRNIYEPSLMRSLGFTYRGMGRATEPAPSVLPSDSIGTQPLTIESN